MADNKAALIGDISSAVEVIGSANNEAKLVGGVAIGVNYTHDKYTDPYDVTPGETPTVLHTGNKLVDRDIVVRAAPPIHAEEYDGPYSVEPKLRDNQVLQTKNKVMINDLTVLKVPVYKTKNATGGYTIYVAERVNE